MVNGLLGVFSAMSAIISKTCSIHPRLYPIDTGMPIKEIRHYAELRADGYPTLSERMEMLVQHRQALNEQITRLQEHKIKLDEKIEFYRNEIERTQNNVSS